MLSKCHDNIYIRTVMSPSDKRNHAMVLLDGHVACVQQMVHVCQQALVVDRDNQVLERCSEFVRAQNKHG